MSERIKNFVVKAVNFGVALGLVGCQVESATNQQRNNPNQAPTPASSPAQDSINNQKSTNQAIKDFAATQTVVAETAKAPEGSNGGKKPAGTIFDADTLKDTTLTHEAVIAGNLLLNNALNWGKAVYEKNGDRVGYPTVTRLVTYSTDGSVKRSVDTSMVMLSDKDANLKGWMVVGMEVHTKDNGGKVVAGKVEINKPLTILKVKNGDVVKETGIGWMDENGTFHSIMQEDQDGKVTMMDDQGKASVVEEGKGMTESLVEQLVGFGATVVYANANEHEPLATFTLSAPKEDQPTQTTTIQPEKEVTPTESTITLTPEPTATEIATEQPTPKIEVPDLKLGMCTTWKEAAKCPISSEYWKNVNSLRKLIAWVKATDTDTFSDKVNITERPTFNTYATSNGHTSLVIWAPSVLDGFKKDPETKPYKWLRHFTTSYQNMNIIFSIQKIVTNNKTRYVPYMTASLNSKYYNEIERLYARIDAVPMGSTPFNSFNPESGPYNYSEPTVLAVRDRILKDWSDTGELPKEVEDYIWLQNID